ncbi:MAG: terminase family protein [Candidatus Alcyoniella australis]|nr:terminase family protein [Candidatus Alcyoniella australis]
MSSDRVILYPFQQRYSNDHSRLKFWEASRQIGKSFTISLEAIQESLAFDCDAMLCSSSMRQSIHLMRKVYAHLRVLGAMTGDTVKAEKESRTECVLPNGRMIFSLPSNPDTIRGHTGNVYLDEYSRHPDQTEIWRAAFPITTRGYRLRIAGSPRGRRNRFYKVSQNRRATKFTTTIYDAVADGLDVDIDYIREGMDDPDGFAQEYECKYIDEGSTLLSHELIDRAEDEFATAAMPFGFVPTGDMLLGFDIARRRHLAVIWLFELLGDVLWTRAIIEMHNRPFKYMRETLYQFLPMVRRACIDSTGLGMQMAEEAQDKFGKSKVEAVSFTAAVKEDLALSFYRAFEDGRIRIPQGDFKVRSDLNSVGKEITSSGNIRIRSYEEGEGQGEGGKAKVSHADRFWAGALGNHAATRPTIQVPNPTTRGRRESIKLSENFNVQRTSWRAGY